jgi:hypothetical protein
VEAKLTHWQKKIVDYQRKYVSMQDDGTEDDLSYIKLINYGEKVITNNMRGYLPMRIVQFLSNIHTKSHSIYISRHGQVGSQPSSPSSHPTALWAPRAFPYAHPSRVSQRMQCARARSCVHNTQPESWVLGSVKLRTLRRVHLETRCEPAQMSSQRVPKKAFHTTGR